MKKKVSLWMIALIFACGGAFAQTFNFAGSLNQTYDSDSLRGFDERAATAYCLEHAYVGKEFPVKMHALKREYINNKYGIAPKPNFPQISLLQSSAVQPACVNEDFEASTAGSITVSNQIQGWTVTRGNSLPPNNACNMNGCCALQPTASAIIYAPNGYIDPKIKDCYPIFSVFGDGPVNTQTACTVNNPQIPFGMKGNTFIRINNDQNDYSMERLSKTFSVTPNNALFQFAFIPVFYSGHPCCGAGAFNIRLLNASAGNTVLTCPQFSAAAPSSDCPSTEPWLLSGDCTPWTGGSDEVFLKWRVVSLDLTSYIGSNITIELVASDCDGGGHYGYMYFDAQCGPMSILGNGVPYPAGSGSVTLPTCGTNGATVCATPGLGPYSWAGPNIPPGYATPSFSNACFITSVSATYTLYMNPPGGCAPFSRVVNTTVTPAPTIVGQVKQATCGDTIAVATITTGGSAGNPAFISWYPPPYSLNSNTTIANYIIPQVGSPPTIISISASDQIGCPVTLTLPINPPAPIPTFTISNSTGTSTLTCFTQSIGLSINTTYTYGPHKYFWASPSMTSSQQSITVTSPANYTVTLSDAISGCARTHTIAIGVNTVMPISTISPTFQNITCTSQANFVTLGAISPTVNFTHIVQSPLGGSFVAQNPTVGYLPGTPGPYTYVLVNNVNGCRTTKTFTIASNEGFPIFDLQSPENYTLGCNSRTFAVIKIVGAQATPSVAGAVSYSLLTPSSSTATSSGILGTTSVYTITTPGTYTVVTRNNANGCDTRLPVSILSNTAPPGIDTILVPTTILTCFTPSITLKGISYAPNINYKWNLPQNVTQSGDELIVHNNPLKPTTVPLANYTLVVEDNSSTCTSTQVVVMSQNLFPPLPSISFNGSLTCINPSVQLSNNSTWGTGNPFPHPAFVAAILWEGPSPSIPLEKSSTYNAYHVGDYTMTVMDMNNGCISKTVTTVPENKIVPLLTPSVGVFPCGANSQTISFGMTTPQNAVVYKWESVPPGALMTNQTNSVLTIYDIGQYQVLAHDTQNGCLSETTSSVTPDTLTARISVDKEQGYAPLTVTFNNLSSTRAAANATNNIESYWVFGNSKTATLSTVSSTTTVYTQPGTYTVTLYAHKGECVAKDRAVIVVDVPSQMIIPNVFTPNNDGVNDLFFLQRSGNMQRITASIYDRWGNKVYEIDSGTGQIEWDGNNQFGKPAPSGTYFYIITGEGRDGKQYDEKGSLSLIR
jgi:gliding motility-associated-like protein